MVDLQSCRLGRPGIELAYFFCSSTTPQQRKEHFEDLFKFYYDQFFAELKDLGDNSEPQFSLEELRTEYDECYAWGFVQGCVHAQVAVILMSAFPSKPVILILACLVENLSLFDACFTLVDFQNKLQPYKIIYLL